MKIRLFLKPEIEVKSRGFLLASPPSIIKCQDVRIRELGQVKGM
jgi:hypothetical protein